MGNIEVKSCHKCRSKMDRDTDPFLFQEGSCHLCPISNAFLTAVKANTRKYYWTGRLTIKGGAVYEFDQDDMVKDSGYMQIMHG